MRYLFTVIASACWFSWLFGQFTGGIHDGGAVVQVQNNWLFAGGVSDGHSTQSLVQDNALFSGGSSDGQAQAAVVQGLAYFNGGNSDGHAFVLFLNAPKLALRMFLEGPYDPVNGDQFDDLRAQGYLPTSEPYTALTYPWVSGGGETVDPAIFNITGNDAIVDWVLVQLRDRTNATIIVADKGALIQRDGDIVDVSGGPLVFEELTSDQYFVSIRHRNHLGAMSLNSTFMDFQGLLMDFTDGSTPTWGSEALKNIAGTNVMWAGNVKVNPNLKYTGFNNDRDPILVEIGGVIPTNTTFGYLQADVTMDGVVKYTGANNDRDPILVNIGGIVPTNTRQQQLP